MSSISLRNHTLGNITIVVLFALLHFCVALVSRALDYYDDIPLTILTITMVIVLSLRNNTRFEIMALLTLAATLIGFLIGSWLQTPLYAIIQNVYLAPALSTFIITTGLGISIDLFTRRITRFRRKRDLWNISSTSVVVTAISILVLRMIYVVMFRTDVFSEGQLFRTVVDILSNTWALLILLVTNGIIIIRLKNRKKREAHIISIASIAIITLITTAVVFYDLPSMSTVGESALDFMQILSAMLLVELLTVTIYYLVMTSLTSRQELREERELKHRTEYQYERLKQQINPHFLFNSLNILDYLVQEHETERASAFIRKLANIYRYLLNTDQKPLVKLSEELDFTNMYIDLLNERFAEGLVVVRSIEESHINRYVVPCSLQLLVENATKHNIVAPDMPLTITIAIESDMLTVRNNLQQRRHGQPSTHLGLANIRRQYLDITRRDIIIEKTDTEFIVKLPIV